MKKKYILALALILSTSLIQPAEAKTFSDIKETDWYYNTINRLAGLGIISGYEDGTYKPENHVTYAEFLTLLNNTIGQRQENDTYRGGIQWYNNTFNFLRNRGVIGNIQDPNAPITRLEMARYLSTSTNKLLGVPYQTGSVQLNDFNRIPDAYKPYVVNAVQHGLVKGDENGNFRGIDNLTRGEIAQVISNLRDKNN